MTTTCRTCDRPVGAPRVERARLVWVCARCADRTVVACDVCRTPLSEPRRYADGFRAYCQPCDRPIRIDATATELVAEIATPTPPPVEAPTPEPPRAAKEPEAEEPKATDDADEFSPAEEAQAEEPEAEEPEAEEPGPPALVAERKALKITFESATGGDYRGVQRAVRIVHRPPRPAPQDPSILPRYFRSPVLVVTSTLAAAASASVGYEGYRVLALGLGIAAGAMAVVSLVARYQRAPAVLPARTRVRAGADGLEVTHGDEPTWRVAAPRVKRLLAEDLAEGVMRVRVELDDGTRRVLMDGLTEEDAHELVAQVDRALPSRQA